MCQLRRLRDYVTQVCHAHGGQLAATPTMAFWMDTLCIPVDPQFKKFRNQAISLMGKTFQKATAVLVLDRELEMVNSTATSFLELVIRILCSGWMKRLWTLEEASFALVPPDGDHSTGDPGASFPQKKLYIQMRDGPFNPWQYGHRAYWSSLPTEAPRNLRWTADDALMDGDALMHTILRIKPPAFQFDDLSGRDAFEALSHRSTSKEEDMPVCAASILGMDLAPILSVHDLQDRLAAFYRQLRSIPEGVLWADDPAIRRLTVKPFRWAPININTFPDDALGMEDVRCDVRGLHVRYAGFVLRSSSLPGRGVYLLASDQKGKTRVHGSIRVTTWSEKWVEDAGGEATDAEGPGNLSERVDDGMEDETDESEEDEDDSEWEESESDVDEDEEAYDATAMPTTPAIPSTKFTLAIILRPSYLADVYPDSFNAAILHTNFDGDLTGVPPNVEICSTIIGYGYYTPSRPSQFATAQDEHPLRIGCMRVKKRKWRIT